MSSINSSVILAEWKKIKNLPVSSHSFQTYSAFIRKIHLYSGLSLESSGNQSSRTGQASRTNPRQSNTQVSIGSTQASQGNYGSPTQYHGGSEAMLPSSKHAPHWNRGTEEFDMGGSFAYQSICMDIFTNLTTQMVKHVNLHFTFTHILVLLDELTRGCKDVWCTDTNFLNFVIAVLQNNKDSIEVSQKTLILIQKYIQEQHLSFNHEEIILLIETISRFLLTMKVSGDDILESHRPLIHHTFAIPKLLHRLHLIPQSALVPLCGTFCQTVYYPSLTQYTWSLTFGILQDPLIGKRAFQIMLDIMNLSPYVSFFRGAVYFVGMASWGTERIESLQVTYSVVLRAMLRVLSSSDPLIIYEVVLNIRRLVNKYGRELNLEWDIISQIIEKVKKYKSSSSMEKSEEIRRALHEIIYAIIKLQRKGEYFGDESRLLLILGGFTDHEIIKFVLDCHKKVLHPAHQDWLKDWSHVLTEYLVNQEISDMTKVNVIELFQSQLFQFSSLSGEDLLATGIPYFKAVLMSESSTSEIRSQLLLLLKNIASEIRLTHRTFEELIGLIAWAMLNCINDYNNQVLSVSLLTEMLQLKFDKLPCSEAPIIFSRLVSSLSHNSELVRKKSLQILLSLRSNPLYHLEINGITSPYLLATSSMEPRKLAHIMPIPVCIEEILSRMFLEGEELLIMILQGLNEMVLNNFLLKDFPIRRIARTVTERLRKAIDNSVSNNIEIFIECQMLLRSIVGCSPQLDDAVRSEIFETLMASLTAATRDVQATEECIISCLKTLIICVHELPKQFYDSASVVFQCITAVEERFSAETSIISCVLALLNHIVVTAPQKIRWRFVNETFTHCLKYCRHNNPNITQQLSYQVMMTWFINCPFTIRQTLIKTALSTLYNEMRESQSSLTETVIDFLLRYTFLSCEQSFDMNDQLANMFNNQQYKAWCLGNGILTAQVGKFAHVLLRYRRPTGTIAWTMKLVNSTHKTSLHDEQYDEIPEYFNQFPVTGRGFPETEHAAASIIASNLSLSTKMSISPLYQDSISASISETDFCQYHDNSFPSDSDSPNNSYFDPVVSSYEDDTEIPHTILFEQGDETNEKEPDPMNEQDTVIPETSYLKGQEKHPFQGLSEDWCPVPLQGEETSIGATDLLKDVEAFANENITFDDTTQSLSHNSRSYKTQDEIPISKSAKDRVDTLLTMGRNRSRSSPLNQVKKKHVDFQLTQMRSTPSIQSHTVDLQPLSRNRSHSGRYRSSSLKKEPNNFRSKNRVVSDILNPIPQRIPEEEIPVLASPTNLEPKGQSMTSKDYDDSTVLHPNFPYLFLRNWTFFSHEPPRGLKSSSQLTRTLAMFDFVPPLETLKVGIIFRAEGQETQQKILSNTYGSPRYFEFLKGIGQFEPLLGMNSMYAGGLDTSDEKLDGDHTITYKDEINHITFHVGTLMPNSVYDENCANKLKHIGNDYIIIVYSENLNDFPINTLSGEFCVVQIIIYPLGDELNRIQVKIKERWKSNIPHNLLICENHIVSDKALPLYVRSLCVHADMITREMRFSMGHYVSNWQHRLRQINNIKSRFASEYDATEEFESSMRDLFDE